MRASTQRYTLFMSALSPFGSIIGEPWGSLGKPGEAILAALMPYGLGPAMAVVARRKPWLVDY